MAALRTGCMGVQPGQPRACAQKGPMLALGSVVTEILFFFLSPHLRICFLMRERNTDVRERH